jgi:hypothetical protein
MLLLITRLIKFLTGLCGLLIWTTLAWGQDWLPPGEMNLPPGVLNVALPDFTNHVGGGDYGLANNVPVEVREDVAPEQRLRIVRTPHPMRLSNQNRATFKVLLGNVETIWFWLEAPPVHGQWRLNIKATYADKYQEPIFGAVLQPDVIQYCYVPPHALLDIRVSSIEQTFKLSKKFLFTLTPARLVLWRDHIPYPRRELWD